jgi:hypothetical protein
MASMREASHAVATRYDRCRSRVLSPSKLGSSLSSPRGWRKRRRTLRMNIEISPVGVGPRWPRLDADLYVPAPLQAVFGSKNWMARQPGTEGDQARTVAKVAASRKIVREGGRPSKAATA